MTAFIKYISIDCADPRRLSGFWSEVTGYQPVVEGDEFCALGAPDNRGVRSLFFWKVPESKVVKNRLHLDLATKDPTSEIEKLVGLGAQKVEYREGVGASWTVMLDPEGNEFCIG
jgi:hypothetical protein